MLESGSTVLGITMSIPPQLEANRVKYPLVVIQSHNIVRSAMFLPIRPKKELWYRLRTYIHVELVQLQEPKISFWVILFDRMVNSSQVIRRYTNKWKHHIMPTVWRSKIPTLHSANVLSSPVESYQRGCNQHSPEKNDQSE
jgi:hypothetical protein